jgi:cell division protein FtsZ
VVDTLLIIPNQNLFRVANEKTTFADAFAMADQVLYSGVACITDLMVKEGLINLDFADVRAVMKEMGKAMMGTGEASGEKRALTAAEAAIANPLIDDASMKGARGLLISITGGRDLTLYEVDEAASRIRGEVDPDANIIVGATFDETLEGIVRVSVVATGIDATIIQRQPEKPEVALKELAGKLRADTARVAERIERERTPPATTPARPVAAAETAAHAAVAAALLPTTETIEDVSIRPLPMKPSLFEPSATDPMPPVEAPPAKTFIPPAPERAARTPRMPRVDELPLPAQAEIRAQRGEPAENQPEKQRLSLMQRLANVGLGRRENEPPRPVQGPPPQFVRTSRPAAPSAPEVRPSDSAADYARRPAPQGLDPHGRPAVIHNQPEEDQLDIPAFLRRQAN